MLRVLIAEDEDMIRKGLVYTTDWLSMGCVVVAEASDGKDGYEKILECRPDVVITDICMPFMDGIEMIKKASKQVKFKSILLTSYADFEYARRAIEARVCEYILKEVQGGDGADGPGFPEQIQGAAGGCHAEHKAVPDQRDIRGHRVHGL